MEQASMVVWKGACQLHTVESYQLNMMLTVMNRTPETAKPSVGYLMVSDAALVKSFIKQRTSVLQEG